MKLKYIFLFSAALLMGTSCSDFLDKEPISDNVDGNFFTAENQLEPYCNNMYGLLPDHGTGTGTFGYFTTDNNSDDMTTVNQVDNFLPQRVQVPSSGSYGSFSTIRTCNLFLERTQENLDNGTLSNDDNVKHYIGEMYFFRAYVYFSLLKAYGDFPIVTEVLTDGDYAANVEANKRKPRNEVARFILSDLDKAIERLYPKTNNFTAHRLNRECALLFKSRVALYEATWEKYHAGTARVPGGPGWPGDAASFHTDLNTEISFFLDEAMAAAKEVGDASSLMPDYAGLYSKTDLSGQRNEVLLWRMYSEDAKVQNQVVGATHGYGSVQTENGTYIFVHGDNTGFTRSLVDSYLMADGLPIYASSNYQGDKSLVSTMAGRDQRLVTSVAKPGDKIMTYNGQNIMYQYPGLTSAAGGIRVTSTGYIPRKGWIDNDVVYNNAYPLALPIFRAAEAYLNYIEAYYLKNNSLDDATLDKYWKALRSRAGVDTDYKKTIAATDLTKEIDLARYSGTQLVDATLYNIRRERRSELIAEGMRRDDLYRWRSLDMMQNYWMEGMNYWDEFHVEFENACTVCKLSYSAPNEASVSKYLRPQGKNELVKKHNGYCFETANYLSPLSYDVFRLSTPEEGGDVSTSVVYQNPGWPVEAGGFAIQ
ncbi:RagB/SusD family nutrient uptake outer membrane protein [uncultured Bacteroides sp.]|uniref:RagB/SusD family nutrient uptake outer membrane protein n=1 Tax=uncultured Bacteroides sp. TaxID=162156 RepID=UPI0026165BF7|nr:RagB/SusD family nutrient uptake outer membrane protein [uncultured Bacteroides sp.]